MGGTQHTPEIPVTVESLKEQVNKLQTQIDKETKGLTGTLKKLGTILAFLAAIFAVPKGALDLYERLHSRPNTQITPESALLLSYEPKTRQISVSSDFTISNTGERLDTIKNMGATLQRSGYASPPLLSFGDNDFAVFENSTKITNRFPVNKDATRSLTCQLVQYISDDNKAALLQPKSRWELTLEFTGEYQHKYPVKYCFDISPNLATEFATATEKVTKKFLSPWCDQ